MMNVCRSRLQVSWLLLLATASIAPAALGQRAGLLDHTTPAYLEFNAPAYTVDESSSSATITIIRGGEYRQAVSVQYSTRDGSALAGQDYSSTTGTLTIPAGVGFIVFSIPILADTDFEESETVQLTLNNPSPNGFITRAVATLTILDSRKVPIATATPPALTLRRSARGKILLSWRPGLSNCILERTEDPVRGRWVAVSGPVEVFEGTCTVAEPAGESCCFYRLRNP